MLDTAILFAQTVATGSIAAWMFTGVRDNVLYPSLNEDFTSEVMRMERLKDGYPDAYRIVAHRTVANRRTQRLAFWLAVLVESAACVILIAGTVALALALFGAIRPETARVLAIFGSTVFTAVWAGMLIIGNHFNYWFGHEGAQNTHFQMLLWGLGTTILLAM